MSPSKAHIIEPGAEVDLVVCGRAIPRDRLPPMFADNVYGQCSDCEADIMWRPHVPDAPKICMSCAADRVEESGERPQVLTTKQCLSEVILSQMPPEGSC
jgi:hypothetical protein